MATTCSLSASYVVVEEEPEPEQLVGRRMLRMVMEEQLRLAESELKIRTKMRNALGMRLKQQKVACEKSGRTPWKLERVEETFRREIDLKLWVIGFVEPIVNQFRWAEAMEDIDEKVNHTRNKLLHEIIPTLKEEKQLLRELEGLQRSREQLVLQVKSAPEFNVEKNMRRKQEYYNDLETLKKDLYKLERQLSMAVKNQKDAHERHERECRALGELEKQYQVAKDICDNAEKSARKLENYFNKMVIIE